MFWWIVAIVAYFAFACMLGTFLAGSSAPYQHEDKAGNWIEDENG